ncbi:MAG TPA: AarF/ABC1/UbiB kinase family protein [Vicinamibacterales bacterium]|nr:AarF/ABC1/UbiB kinase family protein [Vicinamibacterales bacterium]
MNAVAPQAEPASALRRVRQVAAVLTRHGLADVGGALGFRSGRVLPRRRQADSTLTRPARLRLAFEELGPTFVKFGQALSLRPDLVAPSLVAELAKLQDHAQPLPPGQAEAVLEAQFHRPVRALFSTFDAEPFAAGSMAQVHRATLPAGDVVAVKIRRPGIAALIDADLEILRQLAQFIDRHLPGFGVMDPVGLVDEFARTIRHEQDLTREARNIQRCAQNFAGDAAVHLPKVYGDLTTTAVLTLEFIDGLKVSELARRDVSPFVRQLVARRGADAMLRQYLEHGFFHADPHPGNIFVLPDHVIAFLDFGMVGRLDADLRDALARVIRAVAMRDADRLARLALEIAETRGDTDVRALRQDLAALIATYGDVAIGDLSLGGVLRDVVNAAAKHQLRLPSNLMLLIKSVVTIESVGRDLDPAFKMVEHARPMAERVWRAQHSPQVLAPRAIRATRRSIELLADLPRQADGLLRKARDGRLEVQFVHRNLDHFVREMDRSSNRLSFAVVIAAILIGSSLVMHAGSQGAAGYPTLGLAGFVIAGVLGVGLAIGIVRSGRL